MLRIDADYAWDDLVREYPNRLVFFDADRTEKVNGKIEKCFVLMVALKNEKEKAIRKLKKEKVRFEYTMTIHTDKQTGLIRYFQVVEGPPEEKTEEPVKGAAPEGGNKYAVDWYSDYTADGGVPTGDNLDDEKKDLFTSILSNNSRTNDIAALFENAEQ